MRPARRLRFRAVRARGGVFRASVVLLVMAAVGGPTRPLAAQDTHVLVVAGLGGEPSFRATFVEWGSRLVDAATRAGVPVDRVVFLAEDPSADPDRIRARSTREEVERAFREIGERASAGDRVLVVLIGHGAGAGPDSRVSLPGPSLRAADYADLLDALSGRQVAVVNVASASGDFVPVLAGEGRVIVTATRSAAQRNASVFGGFFVEAFAGGGADLDRDGRVSLLEAFEYARRETEREYRDRGLIATEQALLEDRTEGRGVALPMEEEGVGSLAARFFLSGAPAPVVAGDEAASEQLLRLYSERERIEDAMADLRRRRATMPPARYDAELEELAVELARVGREIRVLEGGDR